MTAEEYLEKNYALKNDWNDYPPSFLRVVKIMEAYLKAEGTLSCNCPKCGKEMTSQLIKHHHCKECKEHFTTT